MQYTESNRGRFVPIKEFCARSSLSRATVYRLIDAGELERPTRISPNRVAFPERVVTAFLERDSRPEPEAA